MDSHADILEIIAQHLPASIRSLTLRLDHLGKDGIESLRRVVNTSKLDYLSLEGCPWSTKEGSAVVGGKASAAAAAAVFEIGVGAFSNLQELQLRGEGTLAWIRELTRPGIYSTSALKLATLRIAPTCGETMTGADVDCIIAVLSGWPSSFKFPRIPLKELCLPRVKMEEQEWYCLVDSIPFEHLQILDLSDSNFSLRGLNRLERILPEEGCCLCSLRLNGTEAVKSNSEATSHLAMLVRAKAWKAIVWIHHPLCDTSFLNTELNGIETDGDQSEVEGTVEDRLDEGEATEEEVNRNCKVEEETDKNEAVGDDESDRSDTVQDETDEDGSS